MQCLGCLARNVSTNIHVTNIDATVARSQAIVMRSKGIAQTLDWRATQLCCLSLSCCCKGCSTLSQVMLLTTCSTMSPEPPLCASTHTHRQRGGSSGGRNRARHLLQLREHRATGCRSDLLRWQLFMPLFEQFDLHAACGTQEAAHQLMPQFQL